MKQIHVASNRAVADMMKGILENNNIPVMIQPLTAHAAARYGDGYMRILVPKEKQEEAKRLLSSFFDSI